jgi:bifunctional NMN adenylyltransferase/nudix hydrolase
MFYDNIVLIGRFQPVHVAHLDLINQAKANCRRLIVIVGSANKPRTYKDPFTAKERIELIKASLPQNPACTVVFAENEDTLYDDDAWAKRVQNIVKENSLPGTTAIIGHKKDESSFYLDMFPQWDFWDFPMNNELHATDIRDLFFRTSLNMSFLANVVPKATLEFLRKFALTPEYQNIIEERRFIAEYKKQYESLPYPPVFVTVDAIVVKSGHVLLIKRRATPGKGLWAVPGGFFNAATDKSIRTAMVRELREETGLKIPDKVLLGSIAGEKVFDAINRSERGRTITHAFFIQLPPGPLDKVKGLDDAEKAKWVPFSDLRTDMFFDDHKEMINYFTGA